MAEEAAEVTETTTEATETTEAVTETTAETTTETSEDWRAAIQDEKLRDHAGRFTTLDKMVEANLSMRKQVSSAIIPPGEGATDEQIADYRKKLGVPDSVDGYEFTKTDNEADIALQKAAAEIFHKNNISTEQAKAINEWWGQTVESIRQAQIDADNAFAAETLAALKKEWPGAEFDRNKAYADLAAAKVFGDQLEEVRSIETKDGRFVLDHPAFIKMLAEYGREMGEGTLGAVMSEEDSNAIDDKISEFDKKIAEAKWQGDVERANNLYLQQQELFRKKYGSGPIVGSEGRTA